VIKEMIMLKRHKSKRIIAFFIVLLIILFVFESPVTLKAVDSDECYDAFEACMTLYSGMMGMQYAYCVSGYVFCMVYL